MELDNCEFPAAMQRVFPYPALTQRNIPRVQRKCANEFISSPPSEMKDSFPPREFLLEVAIEVDQQQTAGCHHFWISLKLEEIIFLF